MGFCPLRGIIEFLLCVQRIGQCVRLRFFYVSEEEKCLKNSHTNYYLTTITIDLIFIGEPEGNKRLYKGDF